MDKIPDFPCFLYPYTVNTLVPNKHQNRELPVRRIFSLGIGESMADTKAPKSLGSDGLSCRFQKGRRVDGCHLQRESFSSHCRLFAKMAIETIFQAWGRLQHGRNAPERQRYLKAVVGAGSGVLLELQNIVNDGSKHTEEKHRPFSGHWITSSESHIETFDEFIKILSLFFRPWLSKAS